MAPTAATTIAENWEMSPSSRRILVGLLGHGIQLSRTPAMHEAEGRAHGLSYVYTLLDTEMMGEIAPPLDELVSFAGHFGFTGFNVTFPYKQEIIPLLDELSGAAEILGSVNTVVFRRGRRIGHNTDMWGFKESFRRGMAGEKRAEVLLLGAGGAGAAVAQALLESGVEKLLVSDVQMDRAEALASRLRPVDGAQQVVVVSDLAKASSHADGIVNATPVGMAKLPGIPIEADMLRPECWVADIVYFPLETELLREARRRGCRTLSGEGMAVFQAVRAFELFTGLGPDVKRMKEAFAAFGSEPPI
ncbi:shikimate dehydrogenase [Mesorhizobium tianshanense]|uniref:Shikimate dehydrogenase (NADP(+)) n=2 Tax=Mesorhizobium tianshanense TaxID=39844 RepID=A0A562PD50_9HYPH|nr:shikimate dehydrogenase [Mesorhizobium tianshanense]